MSQKAIRPCIHPDTSVFPSGVNKSAVIGAACPWIVRFSARFERSHTEMAQSTAPVTKSCPSWEKHSTCGRSARMSKRAAPTTETQHMLDTHQPSLLRPVESLSYDDARRG